MTYKLILGDRTYSSWSLRSWMLFHRFGIKADMQYVDFGGEPIAKQVAEFAPARSVPTMRTPDGVVVSDSLAIAEELASRHPDLGIWPTDPKARAIARSLACEMHAAFGALREDCPMNLRCAYTDFTPSEAVSKDLRRLETLWDYARGECAPDGPWLCGEYSAVDAFYAPVAARIAGYGLTVSASAQAYVDAHLSDPAFRRWRGMALVRGKTLAGYARDFQLGEWPGPVGLIAKPVDHGPSENTACPYSGKPVTDYLELEGRIFGFCNAFCRDKTLSDPQAWPDFMKLYHS